MSLREKLTRDFLAQDDYMGGDGSVKLEDRVDVAISALREWLDENGLAVVPREATKEMVDAARRKTWLHGPAMPNEFYAAAYAGALAGAPDAMGEK